jgi:hypothetical protein
MELLGGGVPGGGGLPGGIVLGVGVPGGIGAGVPGVTGVPGVPGTGAGVYVGVTGVVGIGVGVIVGEGVAGILLITVSDCAKPATVIMLNPIISKMSFLFFMTFILKVIISNTK